jgi:hypothetical protein
MKLVFPAVGNCKDNIPDSVKYLEAESFSAEKGPFQCPSILLGFGLWMFGVCGENVFIVY